MSNNVALALVFIRQNDNRIQLIVSCKWAFIIMAPIIITSHSPIQVRVINFSSSYLDEIYLRIEILMPKLRRYRALRNFVELGRALRKCCFSCYTSCDWNFRRSQMYVLTNS
jgi:hypothetical protein